MAISKTVERWSVYEAVYPGFSDKNPFVDYQIIGRFKSKSEEKTVYGFYDGEGEYKIRFMPSFSEKYEYEISGNFSNEKFLGEFEATPATCDNHGPVHVANKFHFAYEDGTPYYSVGTTCYAWTHQPDEIIKKTLGVLAKGYFNKIRFCVFPKHYIYNFKDPVTFPYVGTPVDSAGLNAESFTYNPDLTGNEWDFTRFNPVHFRRIETYISELQKMGMEADIIVMHPYDRWGFSAMSAEEDNLYWRYVIARFAAYRNVWWSLANEYDLLKAKTLADWERYAQIIHENDVYNRLCSIHNCHEIYDYSKPWVTHCGMQGAHNIAKTDDLRNRYGKPVVWDEICYEGNIEIGWGNISGQELVKRFWEASMRGSYAGHGETYIHPDNILWWSHGGELHGESHPRLRFLHGILSETPALGLKQVNGMYDEIMAVPDMPEASASENDYEIHYYGIARPSFREFKKEEGTQYNVDIIDTWEMTVTPVGIRSGRFTIDLPGKEYMAIRLVKSKSE